MRRKLLLLALALGLLVAACAKKPKAVGTLVVDPPARLILGTEAAAEALQTDPAAYLKEHVDRLNGPAFAEAVASRFRPPRSAAEIRAALHATARKDSRVIEVSVTLDDPAEARSLCNWVLSMYLEERTPPDAAAVRDARVLDACGVR
jgi:capsular polysaccharide biosynthesis protein